MKQLDPYDNVIKYLDSHSAKYKILEHEPVITSEEAERVTGVPAKHGAKALVLKTSDRFILCVVRGTNKLDYKKVRKVINDRKLRFAKPEEVDEVMGVKIGACYPFGVVANLETIVDKTLSENKMITFSPGVHDKHIQMDWDEYVRVTDANIQDIAA